MLLLRLASLLAASASLATAVDLTGYEYIVVGSGAGGGPLAARLAMAGKKTLLIEAGDDQSSNINTTVPAYNAKASEDTSLAWDFYVRHYNDDARQARDFKTTYDTPGGGLYTGSNPPAGATVKGTFYPRVGSLGGCTIHNAMIAVYPHRSDFDYIASLTGDKSWSSSNMRKYFTKLENNGYLSLDSLLGAGHGFSGWLKTSFAPVNLALQDPQLLSMIMGGATTLSSLTGSLFNVASLLLGDANADTATRDSTPGFFQVPLSTDSATRVSSRDLILSVLSAKNSDGTKKYPLDVRLNCHVTRVTFDSSKKATGVEFLDGKYLYRASPRSSATTKGVKGTAKASKEVIIAGGAYNSPQILKLSGIGPKAELQKFNIPLIADRPGVGTNLQDHYEVAVQGYLPVDFIALNGCTFDTSNDPCLDRWKSPILGDRGIYSSSGFAAAMMFQSSAASEYDHFIYGGPIAFQGYFPGYSVNITAKHNSFSWAVLKAHPQNTAGTVTLRSADPLDTPDINFNYFDTGSGDSGADLQALAEAVMLARSAMKTGQPIPVQENLPGDEVKTVDDVKQYIKDTAWGHHASSTCPIGKDGDPMAVLDSSFRVRGVKGLRVVDASSYPRIPGTFTVMSTYMIGEKAADVILEQETQPSKTCLLGLVCL